MVIGLTPSRTVKRAATALLSLVAGLAIIEGALAIDGRYDQLTSSMVVEAPTLWALPANARQYTRHPDLNVAIEVRTDAQGVRNHSAVSTAQKSSIVGVFGDSFAENRYLDDRFTFTSLLDGTTEPGTRVVNYGVSGYGVDQAYLRYKKYEGHDIRHVVYLFCANDLRNLYETGLATPTEDDVAFTAPKESLSGLFRRFLGRFRVTYLALSVYARLDGLRAGRGFAPGENTFGIRDARVHDRIANSLAKAVVSEKMEQEAARWTRTFALVVRKWRREVLARGRTFTIIVLPREQDSAFARKLFRDFEGSVFYLGPSFGPAAPLLFKNDGHWNEYGNLQAADFLASDPHLPFHGAIVRPAFLSGWKRQIDDYYREHR